MTFYWWSHWFWITLLCNLIMPLIVVVHTYPSQESALEYNQNGNANPNKLVTKLYQTSTTLTWTTEIPNLAKSTTVGKLKLQSVRNDETAAMEQIPVKDEEDEHPIILNNKDDEEYYYNDEEELVEEGEEKKPKKINLEQVEAELEKEDQDTASTNQEDKYSDVKRSAEIVNKTTQDTKSELKLIDTSTTMTIVEKNNYTNFTDKLSSTNSSIITSSNSTNTTTTTSNNNSDSITTAHNLTTQLPPAHPPATPRIVKAQLPANLAWLNTVAAQLPPAHVTTDVTQDYPGDQHKIPFTLENVNKPEDLRREESEHRTRKSKGLSAEYKVNPYINYSADSKNLLTRSAATTVNEYESEENNISSEALSIQRPYLMDVGAISAICFTVFGICCTVGTIGIVLYRRRFLNKPQALSEPDSSVYIDDSTMRVSDNSDEMYSLDNDSFLNSLEAMTIQNYWTDTVKHTKL